MKDLKEIFVVEGELREERSMKPKKEEELGKMHG